MQYSNYDECINPGGDNLTTSSWLPIIQLTGPEAQLVLNILINSVLLVAQRPNNENKFRQLHIIKGYQKPLQIHFCF